jgi:cytochrome c biogenesis protein CcdA
MVLFVAMAEAGLAVAEAPPVIQPVSWLLFGSRGCEDCEWLMRNFFPALRSDSPLPLPPVIKIDTDADGGYRELLGLEQRLGTTGDHLPALLAGLSLYHGKAAIVEARDELLDAAVNQFPLPLEEVTRQRLAAFIVPAADQVAALSHPTPATASTGSILAAASSYASARLLFFETPGCRKCSRIERQLSYIQTQFSEATIARINVRENSGRQLQVAIARRLGIPPEHRLNVPMVASGTKVLAEAELTDAALAHLVGTAPAVPFWMHWDEEDEMRVASAELRSLGRSFSVIGILLAGLIDGINPCAFAVIVFLVSYLTLNRARPRWESLWCGTMFCLGVFVCYLLIGLGFTQAVDFLGQWQGLSRAVLLATGVICLFFAVGATVDAVRAYRYGPQAMRFGIPKRVSALIHRLIREHNRPHLMALGTLVLGFAVSSLELVCTGQIYLPVIMYIGSDGREAGALFLLLVYNLAFILPLMVVLLLGVYGIGSQRLAAWGHKHAAATRALTAAAILALAVALFVIAF